MTSDGVIKQPSSDEYFLPVKILSPVFRGIFLRRLEKLYASGDLKTEGAISKLSDPGAFNYLLTRSCAHDWVVYLEAPFGGPEKVFQYLGKYTHRVGISNQRIVSFENNSVVFSYEDRADHNIRKLMTLDALVFAKRFLLHILPPRFVKIRYFGILSNRVRKNIPKVTREAVANAFGLDRELLPRSYELAALTEEYARKEYRCPKCGTILRLTGIPEPNIATSADGAASSIAPRCCESG